MVSFNPGLFGTTLNDEVALLADPFGLDVGAPDEILLDAGRHSFLPPPAQQCREAAYRAELDALEGVHRQGELVSGTRSRSLRRGVVVTRWRNPLISVPIFLNPRSRAPAEAGVVALRVDLLTALVASPAAG